MKFIVRRIALFPGALLPGVLLTLTLGLTAGACSSQNDAPSAPASSAPAPSAPASSAPAPGASAPPASGAAATPAAGLEGFLENVTCDELRGWAWDPSQPDRPLSVEIYDGERLLKTVTADQFRQDLVDSHKGNGRHLFIERPPAELKDGKPHTIRAVVSGSGYALRPLPEAKTTMTCAP